MKRFRFRALIALASVPSLLMFATAQATTYNAATNWLSTYPTSASVVSSTSATWGAGSAWSAGELSWNWTNQAATVGNSSLQLIPTFYSPNSVGTVTNGSTLTATYTYTVPYQTYQLNPGSSIQQQVGETFTQQIAAGTAPRGGNHAITLPTNVTSGGAASGYLNEVAAVKAYPNSASTVGFTTTGYSPQSGKFNDGQSSTQSSFSGVWYNYGANATSSSLGALNAPSGAGDSNGTQTYNTLTLGSTFGPSYVAWTAPANGTASINLGIWDIGQAASDGNPSFFVYESTDGPSAPILTASRWTVSGSNYLGGNFLSNDSTTIAGSTIASIANLSGFSGSYNGLSWNSGTFSVTAGETIYFATDPNHDYGLASGLSNRPAGNQDPIALSSIVNFATPEPSSLALMGLAAVGLIWTASKRRRLV
jgi:PEP-CTERM motif